MLFHLSMLISADDIRVSSLLPVCLKCQAGPLMAFYIGHINLCLSPPEGIAFYWPQSIPSEQKLRLVNELHETQGRSVKQSQVDNHSDPLASGPSAGPMQDGFNLSGVTTRH